MTPSPVSRRPVVAVLVDGHPHRLDFAGPEGAATIDWKAEAPDAAPPLLPALAPAN